MDRWISLKFWILLRLIKSWRKKLVSQMQFFVSSLTSFKEGVCHRRTESGSLANHVTTVSHLAALIASTQDREGHLIKIVNRYISRI